MSIPYIPATFKASAFNCPYCNAYAKQLWFSAHYNAGGSLPLINGITYCTCTHCNNYSLWLDDTMIFPNESIAPMPNSDLPEDIKEDYEEARTILANSPRGAAALLRLCIQKLCAYLGEEGKDINKDIKSLVAKGLPPRIQQSLDIVRVVGNNAVHPGVIDLTDDTETASSLFNLINYIVEDRITRPKEIEALYNALPEGKLKAIEARDTKKSS